MGQLVTILKYRDLLPTHLKLNEYFEVKLLERSREKGDDQSEPAAFTAFIIYHRNVLI